MNLSVDKEGSKLPLGFNKPDASSRLASEIKKKESNQLYSFEYFYQCEH